MRYLDWDVLLFPAAEEAAHVPVKEFRTQCYVELHDHVPTPLLTTFIPSLHRNAPFQVSVHSWSKTGSLIAPAADGRTAREVWQVRVVIDGACVAAENFALDVTWPQIMANDNQAHQLRFPPFHRTMLSQNTWNASDPIGRIRIELSSGFLDEKYGRFVKVSDHVVFAFQPGPMDVLEHNGIAWPNQRMYQNPLQRPTQAYAGIPNGMSNIPAIKHRRIASTSNINIPVALGGLATPPLSATFNNVSYMQEPNGVYDAGTRSTSAYSTLTDSAAPLLKKETFLSMHPSAYPGTYPTPHAEAVRKSHNPPFNIRLPSDQLDMIIKAIQVPHQTQHIGEPASTMPPPPLPQHITAPREDPQTEHRTTSFGLTFPPFGENGVGSTSANRRDDSRFSDVSMHPSCTSFPACTTEDAEGHVVHSANCNASNNTPRAPASVVRGRKEGSSPTKPRDFFSTIMDTPAAMNLPDQMETQSPARTSMETATATAVAPSMLTSSSPGDAQGSKKRARSALKSLNINDAGSPEKADVGAAAKPPRKASRASVSSNKENEGSIVDGQENIMDVA